MLKPGGSGRPPVISFILFAISSFSLVLASLNAAIIKSSIISFSLY